MKEYIKENTGIGELNVYRVLSSTALQVYNEEFETLVLPQATNIDTEQRTLTLPYYEGETFNHVWHVSNGGAPMGLSLAEEIPLVLKDLSRIDRTHISTDPALAEIPKVIFKHQEAADYFYNIATSLRATGDLTDNDLQNVKVLLDIQQTTKMIVNNGDFYPRNFIKKPDGKIVLIDWETWNNHSPFFIVDHPENVAAVQYAHMWGNREWQETYLAALDDQFSFSTESFAKGVVMKALSLASFFPEHRQLFDGQVDMIKVIAGAKTC